MPLNLGPPCRRSTRGKFTLAAIALAAFAGATLFAQSAKPAASEFTTALGPGKIFQVRYPESLKTCNHRDGENPDEWSPEECAAEIPVCDNSGHAGDVLMCLAYPAKQFKGSNLQAAAFAVNRLESFNAGECAAKWPRANTTSVHSERIAGLNFKAAQSHEAANNHVADEFMYRIEHGGACYELDVNLTTALDAAFAAEDVPRKLSAAEMEQIKSTLLQALAGFRFLK